MSTNGTSLKQHQSEKSSLTDKTLKSQPDHLKSIPNSDSPLESDSQNPTSARKRRQNKRHSAQRKRQQELRERIDRDKSANTKFVVSFPDSSQPILYPGIRVSSPPHVGTGLKANDSKLLDYKGTGAKPKNIKHVDEVGTSISVSTSSSSKAGQKSTDNSKQIPVAFGEQQSVEIKKSSEQIAEAKLIEDSIKAILHSQSQLFNFVPANQASELLPVTDTQYQTLLDNSVPEIAELQSLEFLKNKTDNSTKSERVDKTSNSKRTILVAKSRKTKQVDSDVKVPLSDTTPVKHKVEYRTAKSVDQNTTVPEQSYDKTAEKVSKSAAKKKRQRKRREEQAQREAEQALRQEAEDNQEAELAQRSKVCKTPRVVNIEQSQRSKTSKVKQGQDKPTVKEIPCTEQGQNQESGNKKTKKPKKKKPKGEKMDYDADGQPLTPRKITTEELFAGCGGAMAQLTPSPDILLNVEEMQPKNLSQPLQHPDNSRHSIVSSINKTLQSNPPVIPPSPMLAQGRDVRRFSEQGMRNVIQNNRHCLYCKPCDNYHFSLANSNKHIKSERHIICLKHSKRDDELKQLKPPKPSHLEALTQGLDLLVQEQGISPEGFAAREEILHNFREFVAESFPELKFSMHGSSVSGFGLNGCDINISVAGKKSPKILVELKQLLENDSTGTFSDVVSDFTAVIPVVSFKSGGHKVTLVFDTFWPHRTAHYLKLYNNTDPRVRSMAVIFRYLAKVVKIDNPEIGTLPPYIFDILTIYYLQRCRAPVLPVYELPDSALQAAKSGNLESTMQEFESQRLSWQTTNTESLGSILISMLRFYAIDVPFSSTVIQIRSLAILPHATVKWANKRMSVEDPFIRHTNIARSITHLSLMDYITDHIRNLYLHFGQPPLKPHLRHHLPMSVSSLEPDVNDQSFSNEDTDAMEAEIAESMARLSKMSMSDIMAEAERSCDIPDTTSDGEEVESEEVLPDYSEEKIYDDSIDRFTVDDYTVRFDASSITKTKGPNLYCADCQRKGHLKAQCPANILPPLKPLPPMTHEHDEMLTVTLENLKHQLMATDEQAAYRERELSEMRDFIRKQFPDADIFLFGSSINGFGFSDSDLDISMTLGSYPNGLNLEEKKTVINSLSKHLRKLQTLTDICPITTAKVPIIKFFHRKLRVEGDISMENKLGLHNSNMLHAYSSIDSRVAVLGYTMKLFAKVCDICDASRGSLSSYAYTLMVIYYLQQREPPVLPVLQELYEGEQPEDIVGEWNTWFYRDIENLDSVWSGQHKNTESISELWIGLLRFYTEEFRVKEVVVCIRQHEPLTRFEKLWNGSCFAIEDPFDLSHNLGRSLSLSMQKYTITAFRKGRQRFGTPVDLNQPLPRCYKGQFENYFFDQNHLVEGERPIGRGCNNCGKLDHKVRDCPYLRKREKQRQMNNPPPQNRPPQKQQNQQYQQPQHQPHHQQPHPQQQQHQQHHQQHHQQPHPQQQHQQHQQHRQQYHAQSPRRMQSPQQIQSPRQSQYSGQNLYNHSPKQNQYASRSQYHSPRQQYSPQPRPTTFSPSYPSPMMQQPEMDRTHIDQSHEIQRQMEEMMRTYRSGSSRSSSNRSSMSSDSGAHSANSRSRISTSAQQGIRVPTVNQAGVRHARFQSPEYHINVSPQQQQQQQFNTPNGSSSPRQ